MGVSRGRESGERRLVLLVLGASMKSVVLSEPLKGDGEG